MKPLIIVIIASLQSIIATPLTDGRIVGGKDADIADYPYQISLEYYGSHICGGSIIATRWVVTAAHCTNGLSATLLSVRAGTSILGTGGQVVKVKQIHQHPQFSTVTIDYDLTVLELDSDLTVDNAKPIPLINLDEHVGPGSNASVTGWGYIVEGGTVSKQLQVVNVPVLPQFICSLFYGESLITDRMMCAGLVEGGKDACHGDSGGPMVVDGVLVGVVSWGHGCARPLYPGVYSKISAIRTFIYDIAGF